MRGVREHVDHARRGQAEAPGMHQHAGVARKRRRIARDVQDALRPFVGQRLDDLDGAFARRVDQ